MKTAIVHYWLFHMRGGEKVVEALCEMYPDADIYTHVYDPDGVSETIRAHRVETSFISRLPFARRAYQKYLPLMPLALEELDLTGYDLVISSESGPAKGVITRPDATHICYCHSPMRYVWDHYHVYKAGAGRLTRTAMPWLMHGLRQWDFASAQRVDHFVANSTAVQARIKKFYRRDARVIAPPCAVDDFAPVEKQGDFYLFVSQLVGYKRADLAIDAFNTLGLPLVVIGEGEERKRLEKRAGPTITFLGKAPFETLKDHYARCKALIFPGEEDFGIVPVEAMASGRPVIAFDRGGARDTVIDGQTGLLFGEQSVSALIDAVKRFENGELVVDVSRIREHAAQFSRDVFKTRMHAAITGWVGAPQDEAPTRQSAPSRKWG